MTASVDTGRFISVEDGFNIKRPDLPPRSFDAERDRALAADTPTGWIDLDMSAALGTPFPATTPLMLARYGRIRAGETLRSGIGASAEICFVIRGRGRTVQGEATTIDWGAGDILCLPGGPVAGHTATDDAVLYAVTDAPTLAFLGLRPAPLDDAPIAAVRYPAATIAAELEALCRRPMAPDTPGRALFLTSDRMAAGRTCTPSLTLTLNAVLPGERQTPHRHNAAALVFVAQGGSCVSRIGDDVMPWAQDSVLLTPPTAVHSHRNDGDQTAVALIVQDGGLHYHCRTMGFAFA